jgi:hypothetical protein
MLFTDGIGGALISPHITGSVGLSFPPTSLYSIIGTYFTPFDSC